QRQIDRRAVEVERIPKRERKTNGTLAAAEFLQLEKHGRQDRFRRRRAENNEQFLPDIAKQLPQAEPVKSRQHSQDHEHKEDTGDVERHYQKPQIADRFDTVLGNDERDCTESAEWCE